MVGRWQTAREPMRACDVHVAVESLLGEPVRSTSVKVTLVVSHQPRGSPALWPGEYASASTEDRQTPVRTARRNSGENDGLNAPLATSLPPRGCRRALRTRPRV